MGSIPGTARSVVAVLLIFDNSVRLQRAHDVAVAYLLAMQDVPVQLRLGASIQRVGKPGIPRASGARDRRFKSDHADLIAVWPNGKAATC